MSDLAKLPRNAALLFIFFSAVLIVISDWTEGFYPPEFRETFHAYSQWLYVLVATYILFYLLQRLCGSANAYHHELQVAVHSLSDANRKKLEILDTIPVSVWEEDFSAVKVFIDNEIKPKNSSDLREWFKNNPEGTALLARKVNIISIGGTTLDMFAADSESHLISNLESIFTGKSLAAFSEEVITFYEGKRTFNAEAEQKTLSGRTINTSRSACLSDSALEDWGLVIVAIEDISKKVQSKAAIDSFFELDMNLHIIAALDGTIMRINDGWTTALGYSREDLEGGTFLELVHPDDLDRTLAELSELGAGKKTYYFENRYKHKDGSYRWLSWSAVVPSQRHVVYAVASDITDRKMAEEKLRDSAHILSLIHI